MKRVVLTMFMMLVAVHPTAILAAPNASLKAIYASRPDLHNAFDPVTYQAIPGSPAGFLINLEDWAHQYGWREHKELASYSPRGALPVRKDVVAQEPEVSAEAYIILDRQTGQIMAAKKAGMEWPLASLTKLVTAKIVIDSGIDLKSVQDVRSIDDVGGAKLWVEDGTQFTLDDLMYATLTASANNAAYAVSRSTGMSKDLFVQYMNQFASSMNLNHTVFADPSGIEVGNVSTPREIAAIANEVFKHRDIRRYTSTAFRYIESLTDGSTKRLKNTNWMLYYPEYDDIYIMSGKTGYLIESKWNLLVSIRPEIWDQDRELMIVTFGSDSRTDSFKDSRALADWAWQNHTWQKLD